MIIRGAPPFSIGILNYDLAMLMQTLNTNE